MLKKILMFITLFLYSFSFGQQWECVGLDSLEINCLHVQNEYIFAGTNKGLYISPSVGDRSERLTLEWFEISSAFSPVIDITSGENGEILVTAGDGSWSDGVYGGLNVLDGPPYFDFQVLTYLPSPEKIAYLNDTLMVSSEGKLYYSTRKLQQSAYLHSFENFASVTYFDSSFGSEDPYVSDISTSKYTLGFLASGYNDKSSVLWGNGSSLSKFHDSVVTTVSDMEYPSYSNNAIFFGGMSSLYIFRADTGFLFDCPVYTEEKTTPENSKVNDVIQEKKMVDEVYAAFDCGVYKHRTDTHDDYTSWEEIGEIPEIPTDLVAREQSGMANQTYYIYAATKKGVYGYRLYETSISPNANKSIAINSIRQTNGVLSIDFQLKNIDNNRVKIFNLNGQCLYEKGIAGKQSKLKIDLQKLNLANGTYVLEIFNSGKSYRQSFNYLK